MPKRVRIEDADIPALARHLDGVMPAGDVEKVADKVNETPSHGLPNENRSGTLTQETNQFGDKTGHRDPEFPGIFDHW